MRSGIFFVSLQRLINIFNMTPENLNNFDRIRSFKDWTFFTDEEMTPRQPADRGEVINAITPLANDIVEAVLNANNAYLGYAEHYPIARQQPRFCAENMHAQIIEWVGKINGVENRMMNEHSSDVIFQIGNYKLWVKKLDDSGLPNVNNTKSSQKRCHQKADGEDTLPMLVLGYQIDSMQRITSVTISCIKGDKHLWAPIDVIELTGAYNELPMVQTSASQESIDIHVKPNKKKRRKAE